MLSYFLITWVVAFFVAFFVLCLPLLFITDKEKKLLESKDTPTTEEYNKLFFKVLYTKRNVTLWTGVLNIIFLITLPYIIDADFNFPFHYNTYMICLIIIIFLHVLLTLIYPKRSGYSHPFDYSGMGGGNNLILFLISFPFIPGIYLTNLVNPL